MTLRAEFETWDNGREKWEDIGRWSARRRTEDWDCVLWALEKAAHFPIPPARFDDSVDDTKSFIQGWDSAWCEYRAAVRKLREEAR